MYIFLFGKSDDTDDLVYIGQATVRKNGEGVLNRLFEHRRDPLKDYWTEAIVFITSNNSFGPTEISYLEHRFVKLAQEAGRYIIKNSNEPMAGNITEEKESELEEFIDYAKIIMGTLGHKVFIAKNENISSDSALSEADHAEPTLYLSTNRAQASGRRTSDGFVVFKGSKVAAESTESCYETIKALREKHTDKIDANMCLTEDILFNSPSAAAAFVYFGSANGLIMWKTDEGTTLKDLEA